MPKVENIFGPRSESQQTNVCRADYDIRFLQQHLLPHIPRRLFQKRDVSLCVVGLGYDAFPLYCTYQPYFIQSFLDANNISTTMTLVEKDSKVLEAMKIREYLYIDDFDHKESDRRKSWTRYLHNSKQHEERVTEIPHDISFHDGKELTVLKQGLWRAPISQSFQENMSSGSIQLIHGDISSTSLGSGNFDYVSFANVSYLLSGSGQEASFYTTSESLKPGGIMHFTEGPGNYISDYGRNWLTQQKEQELGLVRLRDFWDRDSHHILYKKVHI